MVKKKMHDSNIPPKGILLAALYITKNAPSQLQSSRFPFFQCAVGCGKLVIIITNRFFLSTRERSEKPTKIRSAL